jgi:hypothetical protein|nr:MAG TPA: hypothetical protein [Caudoviricetes sp.]
MVALTLSILRMEKKETTVKTQSSSFDLLISSGGFKERVSERISFPKTRSEEQPLLI